MNNDGQEIPGVDIAAGNLGSTPVTMRFTIAGKNGILEYQETQETETDPYGMINVIIGHGTPTGEGSATFNEIYWADAKTLTVEIDINNGGGFILFSEQPLYYIPYVKHREIIADGVTNLNADLNVNNESPSYLSGNLTVDGDTQLNGKLEVNDSSSFQKKVTIKHSVFGDEDDKNAHALLVETGGQGIAVNMMNTSYAHRDYNYLTFFSGNTARGRIEGFEYLDNLDEVLLTSIFGEPSVDDILDGGEENTDPADVPPNTFFANDYTFNAYLIYLELLNSSFGFGVNLGAALATGCTVGDCDDALWSFIDMGVAGWQFGAYISYNQETRGVAFESGGADYAEWLKKRNPNEKLTFGEIVGVDGGEISKSFTHANTFMVISQNPTVIGAMPPQGSDRDYAKVAFMGQVPIKVIGQTNIGDYILPSGQGDGMGISVSPDAMKLGDYKNIVGIAWSSSAGEDAFSFINTAVGINHNDNGKEIEKIQQVLDKLQKAVANLDADYEPIYLAQSTKAIKQSTKEETKSPTLAQIIAQNSGALMAKSYSEAFKAVAKETQTENFDILKMPYIAEAIKNPTVENAQKIVDAYSVALKNAKALEQTMNSKN